MNIGKNSRENWELFDKAKKTDWWFHLDKFPSGHIYCENISKENIIKMANKVKENSKYKNIKNIKVVYTQKNNLKKGNIEGEIIIKSLKKCKYINI